MPGEDRVADLRRLLDPAVDRAGDQRPALLLRQLRDPPEQQPLVRRERPDGAGEVDVLCLLVGLRDILLDDFGAGGALCVQHRPLHQVQPHPHVAGFHRLLDDAIQYRCREHTRIELDPDPVLEDAPDLPSIVGREVYVGGAERRENPPAQVAREVYVHVAHRRKDRGPGTGS